MGKLFTLFIQKGIPNRENALSPLGVTDLSFQPQQMLNIHQ